MHRNSALLFQRYALEHFRDGQRVLEIGPEVLPSDFQTMVGHPSITWDTLDIDGNPELTYSGVDPYDFPIESGLYDVVFSGQVIEHVPKIWRWLPELARVCRAGGLVITINPVSWPHHEAPVDCWRAYPPGMRALYEDAGLEVLLSRCESVEGERYRRVLPGMGLDWQKRRRRWMAALLGPLGYRVQVAFDTLTVGRKTL